MTRLSDLGKGDRIFSNIIIHTQMYLRGVLRCHETNVQDQQDRGFSSSFQSKSPFHKMPMIPTF